RVWCGYSCPQTVWTKIFIGIETFAEGNRNQRIKLASSPWNAEKIRKVSLKHSLWFVVSLLTAIGFLAYFTPIPVFSDQLLRADLDPWQWFWLIFFTAATYINAGWMREQVCLHGCPYARFQSIMFDADTLIVSYDAARGENRGPRKRGSNPKQQGLGDCVDCMQCVHVCPTGIDIRNGLQYECISCAACVDACDEIMGKMGYEKGLVRYTTQNALDKKPSKGLVRPRILTVGVLLAVMGITLLALLITRMPAELNVIKDRSALYRESAAGWIENNYILKLLNKTQNAEVFSIKVNAIDALRYRGPHEIRVEAGEIREVPVSLEIRPDLMTHANQLISFKIAAKQHPDLQVESESRFIGPLWVEQK
ncbi:MAG TPA: cytochrome c oxidase accessory protein CcoG, partial [Pseudomonadales bacterium]|nr:cytochrome c oxidase accessory protein CcoG [Pseudomonadales bacterium]